MALIILQLILKRSKFAKDNLSKTASSQLKVTNTLALSKFASATVIECAELSFLVVTGRNGNSSIVELTGKDQDSTHTGMRVELEG